MTFSRDGRVFTFPVQQPPDRKRAKVTPRTRRRLGVLGATRGDAEEFFRRFPELRGRHWFRIPTRSPEQLRRLIAQTGVFSRHEGWVVMARGDQALWVTRTTENDAWMADGVWWTRTPDGFHMRLDGPTRMVERDPLRARLEALADSLDLEDR